MTRWAIAGRTAMYCVRCIFAELVLFVKCNVIGFEVNMLGFE